GHTALARGGRSQSCAALSKNLHIVSLWAFCDGQRGGATRSCLALWHHQTGGRTVVSRLCCQPQPACNDSASLLCLWAAPAARHGLSCIHSFTPQRRNDHH